MTESTLGRMPDASVDCVVTSPPYWGLRDLNPEYAQPWPTTGSEYHGQAAPEVEP